MWFERILKYLPNAKVVLVSGTRKQREKALTLKADWFIINYEMLHARPKTGAKRRAQARLARASSGDLQLTTDEYYDLVEEARVASNSIPYEFPPPKVVIFDESHHLKSPDSRRAQAARDFVADPDILVYMLTGTPIKRDPDDLFMQLHILAPHEHYNPEQPYEYFSSYYDFVRKYCVSLPSPYGSRVVAPRKKPIEQLMERWAFYTSYEEADIYRPPLDPEGGLNIEVRMNTKTQKMYNEIATYYALQDADIIMHSAMEVMHALRTVTACQEKIDAAVEFALDFPECVIYTAYVQSAHMIADAINRARGIDLPDAITRAFQPRAPHVHSDRSPVTVITGDMPPGRRHELLEKHPHTIVGTLGTISEGHDLSYMKAVAFFEETWTPLEIEQGIDRVRRAGSTQSKVFLRFFNVKNSIDSVIHAVQQRRGVTAELIVRRVLDQQRAKLAKQHTVTT